MARVTWYGHAAVGIEDGDARILIDPYLTDNPAATAKPEQIEATHIIVTHAHGDHLGDAVAIARRTGATIVSNFEIASYCQEQGCSAEPMHIGGSIPASFGRVKLTQAFHGSTAVIDGKPVALGNPAGVVVSIGDKRIYHAGDTGLFGDMKLIGEEAPLGLALLPIGDRFTMGVADAVKAAEFLQAKLCVPIHYNTWPPIEADPNEFVRGCEKQGLGAKVVNPGESIHV